jgi:XTP/dITP diphosphohydrolase
LRRSLLITKSIRTPRKQEKKLKFTLGFPDFRFHLSVTELLFATRNAHKTFEIRAILGPQFKVTDLAAHREVPHIAETGRSFEENAILKAVAVSKHMRGLVIADDSGLEVDVLGAAPGVYSARYAGANATDEQNVEKLLAELTRAGAANDPRRARFRCVLALARDGNVIQTFEGVIEGKIGDRPRGPCGFGYDPVFIPQGLDQTFGELVPAEKNKLSHRARAVEQLRGFLSR